MSEPKTVPERIDPKDLQKQKPLKLASGFNHVVLLAEDVRRKRHIFAWGDCSCGKIAKHVSNVWACGNHSFYQYEIQPTKKQPTLEMGLCAWGLNKNGQLGLSHCKEVRNACEIDYFQGVKILDVSGGEFHTLVLTERNLVYGFGLNRDGQLGVGGDLEYSAEPIQIDIPEEVVRISSGSHFNYAVTGAGRVYSWGAGDNFVLGTLTEETVTRPVLVNPNLFNNEAVLTASAGGQHGLFLTSDLHTGNLRVPKHLSDAKPLSDPKRRKPNSPVEGSN